MEFGRFFLFAVVIFLFLDLVPACHRKRKKRTIVAKTVKRHFPTCMRRQLSGTIGYDKRDWRGAVSFALYHSDWYATANEVCIGATDTVQCWIDVLPSFISGSSPAYRAAQRCIKAYHEYYYGVAPPEPVYRTGKTSTSSSTCTAVDESAYTTEFFSSANMAKPATAHQFSEVVNDDDESLSGFGDLLEFAKKDMICSDVTKCSCGNLEKSIDDADDYEFEDGKSCGSCWSTRLAVSVRSGSNLRGPASKAAKRRGGLKRKGRGRGGGRGRGRGRIFS